MRFVAFIIALVVASASNAHADPFVSKPGGYTIAFPGAPTHETRDAVAKGLKTVVAFDTFMAQNDQIFTVSYADIPASVAGNPIDDSSIVARGTLIARKDIKLFGRPARDLEVALPENLVVRVRFVDIGRRFYQIIVVMPAKLAHTASVDAYFASFRLNR